VNVAITLVHIAAVATGVLLVVAALQKARDVGAFRETLRLLGVPTGSLATVSAAFIAVEAGVGAILLGGQWSIASAASGVALTGAFWWCVSLRDVQRSRRSV
jgi:hypothetical protein